MPTYELAVVLRQMSRPEICSTLKRTAEAILDRGGVIRKLENLGTKALAFKISEHGLVHKEGCFFTIQFDTAPSRLNDLREEFGRDIDIIRKRIFNVYDEKEIECTLHEDLQPPAYRKSVHELISIAQKKQKKKFSYNSGLDYYPFQK